MVDKNTERLDDLRQQTANAALGEPTVEAFTHWFYPTPGHAPSHRFPSELRRHIFSNKLPRVVVIRWCNNSLVIHYYDRRQLLINSCPRCQM